MTLVSSVRPIASGSDVLGEGPHWDAENQQLVRVDVLNGVVRRWRPGYGDVWERRFGGEASAAIPREAGGLLVAVDHTLLIHTGAGEDRVLATAESGLRHTRFNECRCDTRGRLWAGTMSRERRRGSAALYRLEPGGELEPVLSGTTISNGLGWSPDDARMYFIDSPTQRIDVLDYDIATGAIRNRRVFAEVEPDAGMPDGLTVDADGGVWVCLFAGGAIRRYHANGALDQHIPLPVAHPTCPAFGGAGLATLFVTTSRHRLTSDQLAAQPLAGAVLALSPGVKGLPGRRCRA